MSDANDRSSRRRCGADSPHTTTIIVDGPAETTPGPCEPEYLAHVEAERQKWLRWKHLLDQPPAEVGPPTETTTEG
jgi:hypothetical protein